MNESSVAPITSSTPQTSSSPSPTTTIQTASRARCGKAGTGTITLWEIFGGDVAKLTFASLVQKFNDTHPGVTLVTTSVGGFIDLRKKLQALSPDQWPDVVVTSPTALSTMIGSGLVIPPRECAGDTAERGLLPVINATYSIDGVVQAAPYGVSTPVLMFDANEARRAGLDPDHPPKTLDALRAASLQVVSTGVSPHGLVVSDHYGEFMVFQGSSQRGDLVASPNDGHSSGPESVHLVTQSNIDAMKWLAGMVEDGGGVWIGGDPSGSDDLAKVIDPLDGGVFALHTSGSIGDVITAIDSGSFNNVVLGVGPMPGPGTGGTVGGNGMFLIDHGSPGRAGMAWQAIDWLTQPAEMAVFDAATGYVPPSVAVASDPAIVAAYATHPQLRVGYDQLTAAAGTPAAAGPVFGPGEQIDTVFWDLTTKIVHDRIDPAQALGAATKTIDDLITAYSEVTTHS